MPAEQERELEAGRTLTQVRRNINNQEIEPRPRGKRSDDYEYGFVASDAPTVFIPEKEVEMPNAKKKAKAPKAKKKAVVRKDSQPIVERVADLPESEKRAGEPKKKRGRPKGSKNKKKKMGRRKTDRVREQVISAAKGKRVVLSADRMRLLSPALQHQEEVKGVLGAVEHYVKTKMNSEASRALKIIEQIEAGFTALKAALTEVGK